MKLKYGGLGCKVLKCLLPGVGTFEHDNEP
jgi:hypothetical protein